jgi:hypothetical protein
MRSERREEGEALSGQVMIYLFPQKKKWNWKEISPGGPDLISMG